MAKVWVPPHTRKDGTDVKGYYRNVGTRSKSSKSEFRSAMAPFDEKIKSLTRSMGKAKKPALNPAWVIRMTGRSR